MCESGGKAVSLIAVQYLVVASPRRRAAVTGEALPPQGEPLQPQKPFLLDPYKP